MDSKIVIKNILKKYKGIPVLKINDLNFIEGEIIAIMGPNGSGKSTLLKLLCGLVHQDSGTISIFGKNNKDKIVRNFSKIVLESGKGYYDYLTSYQNMKYFLALNKIKLNEIKADMEAYLNYFDFKPHLNKKVSELSQGNRQKLSLIISLLTNPKILCLDEPTNGLDIVSSFEFCNIIKNISKRNKTTVIMTTHDMSLVKKLNARVIILKNGLLYNDENANIIFNEIKEKKYTLIVSKDEFNKIVQNNELKNEFRHVINGDDYMLTVFEEVTKNTILQSYEIKEYKEDKVLIEDILYEVFKNDKAYY